MILAKNTPATGELTALFRNRDPTAIYHAISLLYQDLRRIASIYLRGDSNRTLQATALVHEAYIVLAEAGDLVFENRRHFLNCASLIMRQAFERYANSMKRLKRGGSAKPLTLNEAMVCGNNIPDPNTLLALDQALTKLQEKDMRKYRIVELRLYLGFKVEEIAEALDLTPRTIRRDWAFIKIWLTRELSLTANRVKE